MDDERFDAWTNPATGLGGIRDKAVGLTFRRRDRLTKTECEALYEQNPIAARVIDKIVDDALRHGWELKNPPEGLDLPRFNKRVARMRLDRELGRWAKWGRLYGGSLLTLPTNDSRKPHEPLAPDLYGVTTFHRPQVVIADNAQPLDTDSAFASPTFGRPLWYQISGATTQAIKVHHSRVIPFEAIELPIERQLEGAVTKGNGWGPSVLDRIFDDLGRDGSSRSHAVSMMYIASLLYLKIEGYRNTYKDNAGRAQLRTMLARTRADLDSLGLLGLDAADELGSIQHTFTGAYELIDRMRNALAAACDMPKEILFNESPAGLNAGELSGPQELWFANVTAFQEQRLTPALERILPIIFKTMDVAPPYEFEIEWKPLWSRSEDDASTIAKTDAETDQIYFTMGAASAAEIRQKRLVEGEVGPLQLDPTPDAEPLDLSAERAAYEAADDVAPSVDLSPAIDVVERVTAGKLPRDAGEKLLVAAGFDPGLLASIETPAPVIDEVGSNEPPPADLMSERDAAAMLAVPTVAIGNAIRRGELRWWGAGSHKRVSAADVVTWAAANGGGHQAPPAPAPVQAHAPA